MADNFAFTEGAGKTGASDDVGGVQFARVKLDFGTDGATAPALAGAGAVATGVQRITLASDDPAVALLGTIDTDTGVIAGDTTSIDGKITACNTGAVVISAALPAGTNGIGKLTANSGIDIGDVDVTSIIPGVAATNLGKAEDAGHSSGDVGVMSLAVRFDAGGALAGTDLDYAPLQVDANGALRVTGGGGGTEYTEDVATANPIVGSAIMFERDDALGALTPIEGDWASMRCSAEGALWVQDFNSDAILADTNTIASDTTSIDGKITACNTGAVVLSSGTVTTVSTVTNLAQMGGAALAMNEGVLGVGVQRVTLATDDDGVAHLATIAGDTTSIDGKITACNTGAVVISSGTVTTVSTVTNLAQLGGTAITMDEGVHDAGTQRITLATDDDGVLSLGIIDDWDATHDSAVSADGPQMMAAYDATKPTAVADGDAVRILADEYGRLLSGVEKTSFSAVYDSANATAEAEVVHASAVSTIIVVQSYVISSDVEGWIKLQDEDSTAKTGKFWLKAGGGVAITLPDKAPIVLGVNKDLEVIAEAVGDVSVTVTGYTIPG